MLHYTPQFKDAVGSHSAVVVFIVAVVVCCCAWSTVVPLHCFSTPETEGLIMILFVFAERVYKKMVFILIDQGACDVCGTVAEQLAP